jgi:hypothetical protein
MLRFCLFIIHIVIHIWPVAETCNLCVLCRAEQILRMRVVTANGSIVDLGNCMIAC